jgi:glycosyltransferase involved in cell wall biosynthesis
MSKKHRITVLYGSSGDHMGDDDDLKKFTLINELVNVEWHRVEPSLLAKLLNSANKKGFLTYSFYLAYRVWHKDVYNYCKQALDIESYDLIHYLNPIGYREPGLLWKLDRPYVWGPIGGATSIDLRLLSALPKSGQFKLLLRKFINEVQLRYSARVKKAVNASDFLMAATTDNQKILQTRYGVQSTYIPENGTVGEYLGESKSKVNNNVINLIWIGTIEARKALRLLIDSFTYVEKHQAFKVHVLGNGPLKEPLIDYAKEKGLASVFVWHGHIPRTKVLETIQSADLHVITSVSEGNPTTIWEAMQYGVPTMTLEHCGMKDTISNTSGIKIKIGEYNAMIKDFGRELNKISTNPDILLSLRDGVKRDFYKYNWENRVNFFDDVYKSASENWKNNK